ncbi:hypothetical protein GOBAR_DD07993 [Gossypium barbadense]|nr:hypothetical protein GOBAR_DD07993 [Gossypium barbadense]
MKHQEKPLSFETHHKWHSPSLQLLTGSPPESLLYSYTEAFNGFAASLDEEQPESLSKLESILGMPEIPSKWQGECESGPDFGPKFCNKKLIGIWRFLKGMATGGGISTT